MTTRLLASENPQDGLSQPTGAVHEVDCALYEVAGEL